MSQQLDDNIVEITDLCFSRGQRQIFDSLTIKIRRGDVTAIMGPSGTGKTTLLRLITGQLVPGRGEIRVGRHDVQRVVLYLGGICVRPGNRGAGGDE